MSDVSQFFSLYRIQLLLFVGVVCCAMLTLWKEKFLDIEKPENSLRAAGTYKMHTRRLTPLTDQEEMTVDRKYRVERYMLSFEINRVGSNKVIARKFLFYDIS